MMLKHRLRTRLAMAVGLLALPLLAAVNSDDLLVYVDAGNTASYPGTGTTWTDLTAPQYDLAVAGATFNAGPPATFHFDGNADHAYHVTTDFQTLTTGTFEVWVRPEPWDATHNTFRLNSLLDYNQNPTDYTVRVTRNSASTSTYVADGESWYHCVVAQPADGGGVNLFVNGLEVPTQRGYNGYPPSNPRLSELMEYSSGLSSNSYRFTFELLEGTTSTGGTMIGDQFIANNQVPGANNAMDTLALGTHLSYSYGNYTFPLTGDLPIGRLYGDALTPGEVQQNFNADAATFGLPGFITSVGQSLVMDYGTMAATATAIGESDQLDMTQDSTDALWTLSETGAVTANLFFGYGLKTGTGGLYEGLENQLKLMYRPDPLALWTPAAAVKNTLNDGFEIAGATVFGQWLLYLPEPGSAILLVIAALGILRRRRQCPDRSETF